MKNTKRLRIKVALGFLLLLLALSSLFAIVWLENFSAWLPNIAGAFLFVGVCLLEWYLIEVIYFGEEKKDTEP